MSVEMLTLLLVVWCSVRKTNMYCSYSTLSTANIITVLMNVVVYKLKSHNMYIVLLLNLPALSIKIDNNTKLFMGNYYIS